MVWGGWPVGVRRTWSSADGDGGLHPLRGRRIAGGGRLGGARRWSRGWAVDSRLQGAKVEESHQMWHHVVVMSCADPLT